MLISRQSFKVLVLIYEAQNSFTPTYFELTLEHDHTRYLKQQSSPPSSFLKQKGLLESSDLWIDSLSLWFKMTQSCWPSGYAVKHLLLHAFGKGWILLETGVIEDVILWRLANFCCMCFLESIARWFIFLWILFIRLVITTLKYLNQKK